MFRNTLLLRKLITSLALSLLVLSTAHGQSAQVGIQRLITRIDSFGHSRAPEKLYLHTDKPYYAVGDTIWFKVYLLQAGLLTPSTHSNIMYLELANDSNKVIKRLKLPASLGISWGSLVLDDEVQPGNYIIRAYTNWQRNFDEHFMFTKSINISTGAEQAWLVNAQAQTDVKPTGQHVNMGLQFTTADHKAIGLQPLQLKVKQNKKTLYKAQLQTTIEGTLNMDLDVPLQASISSNRTQWVIEALERNTRNNRPHQLLIPIAVNKDDIDLQFMPEGGQLVAGMPAHIGFKALNSNGYGTNVSGTIKNSKNEPVVSFKSAYKGIGSVDFTPLAAENYTAWITLADGTVKSYPLPIIQPSGFALRLKLRSQATDTLSIMLAATPNIMNNTATYYLLGHAQGIVCSASVFIFTGKPVVSRVNTANFPTGIAHFTLFDASYKPLCERTIFIDHHERLHIKAETDKKNYHSRDSIALAVQVTDENGKPVSGTFSLAVTDDNQVKPDTTGSDHIMSHLLLTDDLKGNIETPGYYLNEQGIAHPAELDNLLLTQGWTGYNWTQVFGPKPKSFVTYDAETDNMIKGRVTNLFNKGKGGLKVTLFSKKPFFMRDTITDQQGRFVFSQLPVMDTTVSYIVQTKNKNGSTFNMGLEVDDWTPPVFADADNLWATPWYVNTDTAMLSYSHYNRLRYNDQEKLTGNVLKTVTIKAKKIVKNSHNFNGIGNADLILDEEELLKTPKKSLLDLLYERIPTFQAHAIGRSGNMGFFAHSQYIIFYFDGVKADFFFNNSGAESHYDFLKGIFNQYAAADVKGIELMSGMRYTGRYIQDYFPIPPIDPSSVAFIEITTRDGKGPFINQNPGLAVYRPLPFSLPKQFYRPKYTPQNITAKTTDLRSTIHWEPNVMTDAQGKAIVSFYAADMPGNYTLTLEGTDLNGRLGSRQGKIKVEARKP